MLAYNINRLAPHWYAAASHQEAATISISIHHCLPSSSLLDPILTSRLFPRFVLIFSTSIDQAFAIYKAITLYHIKLLSLYDITTGRARRETPAILMAGILIRYIQRR